MNTLARQKRANHPLFEFERTGQSSARQPAGHRPDLNNLSVVHNGNTPNNSIFNSNYSRNRSNSNTSASLDFIDLKALPTNAPPQVSNSYDNKLFSKNNRKENKRPQFNNNGRIFDTLFLVDLLNTTKFDKVTEINASSQNLNDIDITALKQLRTVKKADFSDNSLPLEPFSVLQDLEELDLSCNGLKQFEFDKCEREYMDLDDDGRAWNSLHTLNLSHNMCSNTIADLQLIPLLSNLNLSSNSISNLPSNLMYFTCLTTLDLSNNNLNSDASLFSLATIPSLQILNLDYNGLVRIPRFQFGFEALNKISLRSNHFEESDDFDSLADILSLQEVNIIGNPIVVRGHKYLAEAKKIFASAKIELICDPPAQPLKSTISGNVRTVPLDPLTLPFRSRAHKRALQDGIDRKQPVRGSQKIPPLNLNSNTNSNNNESNNNNNNNNDDVFMTAFTSKVDENKNKSNKSNEGDKEKMFERIEQRMMMNINSNANGELSYRIPTIPPARIPPYEEEEPTQTNFWSEIPVVQEDKRRVIFKQVDKDYNRAFNQLQFIVLHPESKPTNINRSRIIKKKAKTEIIEDHDGNVNCTCYNNEESVLNGDFNVEYHEGEEIDEIQDLLAKRNEESQKEFNGRSGLNTQAGIRSRLGRSTPIPTARRSPKSTNTNSSNDEETMTREEVEEIIQNMDDKLISVERDMQVAEDERLAEERKRLKAKYRQKCKRNKKKRNSDDESYEDYEYTEYDDNYDDDEYESGDRFARLNKQYESIRANLLKILS